MLSGGGMGGSISGQGQERSRLGLGEGEASGLLHHSRLGSFPTQGVASWQGIGQERPERPQWCRVQISWPTKQSTPVHSGVAEQQQVSIGAFLPLEEDT